MVDILLAGSGATVLTALVQQPFDVVKTYLLNQHHHQKVSQCVSHIYSSYGIKGFFKGYTAAFYRGFFAGGILFLSLEKIREGRREGSIGRQVLVDGFATSVARGVTVSLLCPLSVVKTRMENAAQPHSNFIKAGMSIAREGGMPGMFKGLGPMLLRDVPYTALSVVFYEQFANAFIWSSHAQGKNTFINFTAGTLGGFTACLLTQPFDVIKNRAMAGYAFDGHGYQGMTSGFAHVLRHEGVRGFTKGISIRAFQRSIAQGLMWTFYCNLRSYLK